jgi:hypothetical protein
MVACRVFANLWVQHDDPSMLVNIAFLQEVLTAIDIVRVMQE